MPIKHALNNASVPVYQSVTVTASEGGNNTTASGSVFTPKTAENFGYDADGNEISDGRWTYTWDGENRLTRLVANTAVGPQQRIDLAYDWKGRRISKRVWNNTAGTCTPALDERYLYDGWNLLAQLNATNNVVIRSYVWGSDLSGQTGSALNGAGGVGGLLEVNDAVNGAHFCAYDGNGNVVALVKASDGTISANYEYDPFGNVIRATGLMAFLNPFRFSTKFQDDESGLLYYGYRYLNASMGRWLSRDPIEERGFESIRSDEGNSKLQQAKGNSYLFVYNDPLGRFDYIGLNPNITPGTTFTVKLQGGGKVTVNVGGHFSQADQADALRGICLVQKLLGFPTYTPPFSDVYWATFTGTPIDGLTDNGSVFISKDMKPIPCNFSAVANFGAVIAHELDHLFTGSDDGPGGPSDRINTPVLDGLRKALSQPICGCCHGRWQLENLLGKYACDCGLTPCRPKPCPKP